MLKFHDLIFVVLISVFGAYFITGDAWLFMAPAALWTGGHIYRWFMRKLNRVRIANNIEQENR